MHKQPLPSRLELLKTSWNKVSALYDGKLAPRFAPWIQSCLKELVDSGVPSGTVFAPCCGTGAELVMLAEALPESNAIMGLDLSEAMIDMAGVKIRQSNLEQRVQLAVGDATAEPPLPSFAAVFSAFGLQQLQPQPQQALKQWVDALTPGGVAAVIFWPTDCESEGPWQQYNQVISKKQGHAAGPTSAAEWELELVATALQVPGSKLVLDERVSHNIQWASANELWEVMTQGGPWNARLLHQGAEHMEEVRREFVAGFDDPDAPLEHCPAARMVVIKRSVPAQASCM